MQKEFRDVYSEPGSHENFSVYPSLVFFLSISRNLISICYSFKSLSDLKAWNFACLSEAIYFLDRESCLKWSGRRKQEWKRIVKLWRSFLILLREGISFVCLSVSTFTVLFCCVLVCHFLRSIWLLCFLSRGPCLESSFFLLVESPSSSSTFFSCEIVCISFLVPSTALTQQLPLFITQENVGYLCICSFPLLCESFLVYLLSLLTSLSWILTTFLVFPLDVCSNFFLSPLNHLK